MKTKRRRRRGREERVGRFGSNEQEFCPTLVCRGMPANYPSRDFNQPVEHTGLELRGAVWTAKTCLATIGKWILRNVVRLDEHITRQSFEGKDDRGHTNIRVRSETKS